MRLPYGKSGIELNMGEWPVITSRIEELAASGSGYDIVAKAMENPIGSARLSELAAGKKTACIIISDHTRPVPSRDIIPHMLRELKAGNPDIEVTLLVATGFHRPTTREELVSKLGEDIVDSCRIVIHDGSDPEKNVKLGILPSGAENIIDKVAAETELLCSEGFVEPHFFAGFSGGRKSVLPGVASRVTVLGNHCSKFIDSKYARTGNLENNPLHIDMLASAKQAKLAYIVNVVIDDNKKTVAAFAGDPFEAHEKAVEFLKPYCTVKPVPADIVITTNGGAPLDQNIYQCVKGMTAAESSAKEGAVIIMCAKVQDGHGGESFYRNLAECESPELLYEEFMKTPQDKTIADQWEAQILARILIKHKVIFVSGEENRKLIEDMKMIYAPDTEKALEIAYELKGQNADVTVIPNGISVAIKE